MRFYGALLRSSSALWVGPIAIALTIWYANKSSAYAPFDPYVVEHTAAGADPLFLTLAVVAACAAWEGGRLRRAGWLEWPNVRSPLVTVTPLLAPPLVAGLVATVAGLVWKLHIGGAGLLPDTRFLPTFIIVVIALVLFGFAVGACLPPAIAAPATLVGVYLWMALPSTVSDPIWLRHMSGSKLGICCGLEFDIDGRALAAPFVVSAGIIGSALALLYARSRTAATRTLVAALPLILGLGGGAAIAHGLPREPVTARSSSLLICSDGAPRVCVWPEHRQLLQEASELASQVVAAWSHIGVGAPSEFTEAFVPSPSSGQRNIGLRTGADNTDIVHAFSLSMLPEWPECEADWAGTADQPAFLGADAYDSVLAWFEATAGIPREALERDYGNDGTDGEPSVLATVDRVRSLAPQDQQAWLQTNLAALSTCDVLPRLEP